MELASTYSHKGDLPTPPNFTPYGSKRSLFKARLTSVSFSVAESSWLTKSTFNVRRLLCDQKALSGEELWPLRLAIGKALDDLGQYREAMEQFDEAHRVALELPATPMFDRQDYQAAVDRIQGICSESLMSQSRRLGLPTAQPIFVVGMLRSGTTLTEQILTCHSQIGGAG